MTVQYFSNLAMVTSVVIYFAAFCMHTVEWASARKIKNEVAEPARDRELAAVGAGQGPELLEGPGSGTKGPELVEGPGSGSDKPYNDHKLTPRQRMETFGRLGLSFTLIGWLCAVAGVVARGIAAGRWPLGNMYEFTTMAMVIIVAAYLVLATMGMRWLGLPVTMLATIGNGLAVTVFYVAVAPLVPSLHSYWFVIHITAASISGAAFNIGGVISILYLIKKRAERRGTVKGYLARLPEARRMDVVAYRVLAFAFPIWTFTIAAGAIWAQYAWGRFWGWDPKEVWALVTWVIFACYLHARATAGWKGTRAAVIAIVGLASFWFNFIGVNLLFAGLHSYAGI
ncbi:c-type cytochrome biogenesis protein CcsB [Microlunatus elymi]|uniref:C-type cytochrome biogenesis protein CcsB n=1 Tax=Microlunatus elymi TaxID=2596828 RepID=A0A516Q4F6_9ACTN|nr:c-type cytochrome biogenesis protein CcsB [Microlunatus elymi]QDP98265.1 c-type cytochrome biogenesis protein CcsB [Microlunatus elymi]